ncbi:hypothetical protein SAMN04488062_10787 [Flavobacterium omnivorum]|uniref:Uncharacterized protein n=1 Tax=Flavobacterium omnivorum TaxID=178355 RepID=A0A1G8C9K6_9FLAO|nr:hypothetical protein SAMN04488062_10787 [Flavobacterium omnivorum]
MKDVNYFVKLSTYAKSLLDTLPIEKEPQPLQYAVEKLYGKLKQIKEDEVEKLKILWVKKNFIQELPKKKDSIGLNTIGSLTDRFTILIIKEWCLRNKSNNVQNANNLFENQTKDIIRCLANSVPGNSAINSKITNIKTDVIAQDWEEAFFGLLAVNLVLWESQEVLYIKDISLLPAEELRAYIHWFAHGNMERNVLMELCESRYWEKINSLKNEK